MQIQAILSEQDLNKAILKYVVEKGYPVDGMDMSINLTKGRGSNGTYATVDFTTPGSPVSIDMEDLGTTSVDEGDETSTPTLVEVGNNDVSPQESEVLEDTSKEGMNPKTKLFG